MKDVADEVAGKIKKNANALIVEVENWKQEIKKLGAMVVEYEDDADKAVREINERAEDMKQLVDQIRDSVLVELRTAKKSG